MIHQQSHLAVAQHGGLPWRHHGFGIEGGGITFRHFGDHVFETNEFGQQRPAIIAGPLA